MNTNKERNEIMSELLTSPYDMTDPYDNSFDGCLEIRNPHLLGKIFCKNNATELYLNFDGEIDENTLRDQLTSGFFNSLAKITVLPENKFYKSIDGILYTKDGKTLIFCPVAKDGELRIPEGTEYIGAYAFFRNHGITNLHFPDSLRYIGDQAFFGIKNLKCIDFGKGIKKIGGISATSIFEGCKQLTEIDIPEQVESIGSCAFSRCSNLKKVTFHNGLHSIQEKAFVHTKISSVSLPSSIMEIGTEAFGSVRDITVDRTVNNPAGLIESAAISVTNTYSCEDILSIHDTLTGKNFRMPKFVPGYVVELLSYLWDLNRFCAKTPMFIITDYWYFRNLRHSPIKYNIMLELYKDNPNDAEIMNNILKSAKSIIVTYLDSATEKMKHYQISDDTESIKNEKQRHIEKLIEFIGLDIFGETELQYIYDEANKRKDTALMAYAMDAIKRCRDNKHKNDLKI